MADTSNFRNGLIMRIGNQLYAIVEFQHVKPGKGGAFVRTKLKKIPLSAELVKEIIPYLKENTEVSVLMDDSTPLSVELPTFVELAVKETDPGLRGDTAQGGSKPAKLETGAVVSVPLFIEVGDVLKVDTRTGRYIERV